MWAITIEPRLNGHGSSAGHGSTRAKNTSMATPMQISGATMGRARAPSKAIRPGKRNRQSATAARAPSTTLAAVAMAAITSEFAKASIRL